MRGEEDRDHRQNPLTEGEKERERVAEGVREMGDWWRPRGAGSDTANRRTATDNDAAKCASVVLGPVHALTSSSHPGDFTIEASLAITHHIHTKPTYRTYL